MSKKERANPQGPWPEKKSPRERLSIDAARLAERWAEEIKPGEGRVEALGEEARDRLTQSLRLIASADDVEALAAFGRSELGAALLRRADLGWALKTCERAGPAAREMIARDWIAPAALRPANSEGERWPDEGALKCLACIVARAKPSEEGALSACEAALKEALSGLQDPAAVMMSAGALAMSLPKAEPAVFGRLCRWLLDHCPARSAGASALLLAAWAGDAFAGRHGEKDAQGMARVRECSRELLGAVEGALSPLGEGQGRELSPGQAWWCCDHLSRARGLEPELARMESRFAAQGFWLTEEDFEELIDDWQSSAKLFWGQRWGSEEPGRGARLSLVSAALFQGRAEEAQELMELGCWWEEGAFFEMARAFRRQEEAGGQASARDMGLLDRSVALGEALALSLQSQSAQPRRPPRSI